MSEARRGCGHRVIGGLYLVSDGYAVHCDGLPIELIECDCCGFIPKFSRGFQWINSKYIKQREDEIHKKKKGCSCSLCYICHNKYRPERFGLMFVGKSHYTTSSFIKEAKNMGACKRISEIPKDLVLGKTIVLLAHKKVPKNLTLEQLKDNGLLEKEPEYTTSIFYAFIPSRIEMPVWKGSLSNNEILALEQRGITPVFIEKTPENVKKHRVSENRKEHLLKYIKEEADLEETKEDNLE